MTTAVVGAETRERSVVARALLRESHPANLAVLRICTGLALLNLCWYDRAWRFADYDDALMVKPYGLGWLVAALPRPGWLLVALTVLVAGCAVCLVVGWRSRWAAGLAAGAGFWVFGVGQLWGKVNHHHHLLWLCVLLAASACGDALAIDQKDTAKPLARYGVPLRLGWLLMGTVYLFPGVAKLLVADDFVFSDHLVNTIAVARYKAEVTWGFIPPGWAGHLLAASAVAFEIGFIFLVLTRWRRWLLVGVMFHLSTWLLMGIQFRSMVILYPALWAFWPDGDPSDEDPPIGPMVAGGAMLAGAMLFGASLNPAGWPFASYPTFTNIRPTPNYVTYEIVTPTDRLDLDDIWPDLQVTRQEAVAWHAWRDPAAMDALADQLGLTDARFDRIEIDARTGQEVKRATWYEV